MDVEENNLDHDELKNDNIKTAILNNDKKGQNGTLSLAPKSPVTNNNGILHEQAAQKSLPNTHLMDVDETVESEDVNCTELKEKLAENVTENEHMELDESDDVLLIEETKIVEEREADKSETLTENIEVIAENSDVQVIEDTLNETAHNTDVDIKEKSDELSLVAIVDDNSNAGLANNENATETSEDLIENINTVDLTDLSKETENEGSINLHEVEAEKMEELKENEVVVEATEEIPAKKLKVVDVTQQECTSKPVMNMAENEEVPEENKQTKNVEENFMLCDEIIALDDSNEEVTEETKLTTSMSESEKFESAEENTQEIVCLEDSFEEENQLAKCENEVKKLGDNEEQPNKTDTNKVADLNNKNVVEIEVDRAEESQNNVGHENQGNNEKSDQENYQNVDNVSKEVEENQVIEKEKSNEIENKERKGETMENDHVEKESPTENKDISHIAEEVIEEEKSNEPENKETEVESVKNISEMEINEHVEKERPAENEGMSNVLEKEEEKSDKSDKLAEEIMEVDVDHANEKEEPAAPSLHDNKIKESDILEDSSLNNIAESAKVMDSKIVELDSDDDNPMDVDNIETTVNEATNDVEMATSLTNEEAASLEVPVVDENMPAEIDIEKKKLKKLQTDVTIIEIDDEDDLSESASTSSQAKQEQLVKETDIETQENSDSGEVFFNKECINCQCAHKSKEFYSAPLFALSAFEVKKRNKMQFICTDCYDEVVTKYEKYVDYLVQKRPLYELQKKDYDDECVQLIDSSDEEDNPVIQTEGIYI